MPTAVNAEFYAQVVQEHWVRRRIIESGGAMISRARDTSKDISEVTELAERDVIGLRTGHIGSQSVRADSDILSVLETVEQIFKNPDSMTGVPTGLVVVDKMLYGLHDGDLIIVAARPSMGKSALAHSIAAHVSLNLNKPVVIFSMEMPRHQILQRMLCAMARVGLYHIREGRLIHDDWRRFADVAGQFGDAPLFLNDAPGMTGAYIKTESRRLATAHKGLGLIVVDYLQLMQSSTKSSDALREQEVAANTRALKELAMELSTPVMVLSQLNRAVENRPDKRPQLSDLRESGEIEQSADVVMFLYRDDYYNASEMDTPASVTEIIIRKHRNGPVGMVRVDFFPGWVLFQDMDPDTDNPTGFTSSI